MNEQKIEEKYKKLLGYMNLVRPPQELKKTILNRIDKAKKRALKIRVWIFRIISVLSSIFLLWSVIYLIKSIQNSGLWQYLSLVFLENSALLIYWKEFSLSVIESLPIMGIIAFLFAVGFFVWSITKITYKKYAFQF